MSGIRDIWVYANNIISAARQMINEDLGPIGLSSAEGNILLHLLTSDYILKQEDLVAGLEISKPAVSRGLRSLEKKGFVNRKKDSADKRVSRIHLTEKAYEIGPKVEKVYQNIFSLAAQEFSEKEIATIIEVFKGISESFSSARQEKHKKGG